MQKINFFQTFLTKTKTNQKDHYHKQEKIAFKGKTPKKKQQKTLEKKVTLFIFTVLIILRYEVKMIITGITNPSM